MSTQGSSGIEIVDLTEDESVDSQAPTPFPRGDLAGSQETRRASVSANEPPLDLGSSSDIEEIFMENTVLDEETRRRNIDRRRERLLANGIDEDALAAHGNPQGPENIEEVIVISDDDEDDDRFAAERRRHRRRRIWEDQHEQVRHRALSPGPPHPPMPWQNMEALFGGGAVMRGFEFDLPPRARFGSPAPLALEGNHRGNLLGGGGFFGRNRLNPHQVYPPLFQQNMHRRSLELDAQRLEGRARAHLDGLIQDQNEAGFLDLLGGALNGAFGRIGDALGWRPGGGWGGPEVLFQREDLPAEGGGWEEREVDLPDAPEYQPSFSHPGKMPKGFTGDFSPTKPDLIALDDSDNNDDEFDPLFDDEGEIRLRKKLRRKNKGKGRAHSLPISTLPFGPPETNPSAQENRLTIVCARCNDPLVIGQDSDVTEEQKVYALLCGHVIDGKCLWKIGVPPSAETAPIADEPSNPPERLDKGKGRATHPDTTAESDTLQPLPRPFEFTFTDPRIPNPSSSSLDGVGPSDLAQVPSNTEFQPGDIRPPMSIDPGSSNNENRMGLYEEDNEPTAAPLPTSIRSRLRSRREIVPTPNTSSSRRRKRGVDLEVHDPNIDQAWDLYNPILHSGGPDMTYSGPPGLTLDISHPFFPRLANPSAATASTSNGPSSTARGRKKTGSTTKNGKLKTRYVAKSRKKLREELFDWVCPVEGCGTVHLSIRLEITGAKWKCDENKGATLMFL